MECVPPMKFDGFIYFQTELMAEFEIIRCVLILACSTQFIQNSLEFTHQLLDQLFGRNLRLFNAIRLK